MAYRILIELFFFLTPFMVFGLYRLLMADAEADGRKAWPINTLFGLGAALAAGVWLFFILRENKERNVCYEPARFENGELIDARQVPCDQDVTQLGIPGDRPTTEPQGVDGPLVPVETEPDAIPDPADGSDD